MASKDLVILKTPEGQRLLSETYEREGCCCQQNLLDIFNKQVGGSHCGITTIAMIMSAPAVPKITHGEDGRVDRASLPYQESNMFTFPQTLQVITVDQINGNPGGMTLDQAAQLLTSHGRQIKKVHANVSSSEQFRMDLKHALSHADSRCGIIINYHMDVLGQDCPYGHFSPLGAYHAPSDRVLILDTWRDTQECWAKVEDLFIAMNTVDEDSGLARGYIVVSNL